MTRPIRKGTGRIGSFASARLRRLIQAQADSKYVLGTTLEAGKDGRSEVRVAGDGLLERRRDGLAIQEDALGDKNLPQMSPISRLEMTASVTYSTNQIQSIADKVDEILKELVKTRRQRKP